MRLVLDLVQEPTPIADSVSLGAFKTYMRCRAEKAILQILTKSVIDGKRDDERRNSGGDSDDRDGRDHSNHGLAALGAEISRRNEELECHC